MKVADIADRAAAYGIPGVVVDGNDVEAVYAVAREAVERARAGGGPTLIEAKTMRMLGHAIHDGAEYVPPELLAEWEARIRCAAMPRACWRRAWPTRSSWTRSAAAAPWRSRTPSPMPKPAPGPIPATVHDGVYA